MDFKDICENVKQVAVKTGLYIAEQRRSFSFDKVEFKGAHNLVSYVDKGAENIIVKELSELLPEAGFLTEEGTVEQTDKPLRWIIDPLDGTTNFVHDFSPYCVSIALMQDEEVVVGVIYEVTRAELFWAYKGSKAFLNDREIHCSDVKQLEHALVSIDFSYNINNALAEFLTQIKYFQTKTDGIRRIGSSATVLAYVAAGRLDAYTQVNIHPWDVAAGALIAERAGAIVSDTNAGQTHIFSGRIVAANPYVYQEFLEKL